MCGKKKVQQSKGIESDGVGREVHVHLSLVKRHAPQGAVCTPLCELLVSSLM